MIQLVCYEMKKIYKMKYIWGMLLALLFINGYKIYQEHQSENRVNVAHKEIYEQIKGEITYNKVLFITKKYKKLKQRVTVGNYSKEANQKGTYTGYIMGDYAEFEQFYEALRTAWGYADYAEGICARAKENISFYEEKGNNYEMKRNQKIYDAFVGRKLMEYYDTDGIQKYLEYDFSTLLMVIMIFVTVPGIWFMESKNNMYSILQTGSVSMLRNVLAKATCVSISALF